MRVSAGREFSASNGQNQKSAAALYRQALPNRALLLDRRHFAISAIFDDYDKLIFLRNSTSPQPVSAS